ncbi:MAG: Rieske 2Fe-2S domain-containing protein [Cellvibrionales bacterium]|nr:Rieske 2Fe-2S domain-containing protein [Cellvibrionales bacterium]
MHAHSRFPLTHNPSGWYYGFISTDLKPKEIKNFTLCDKEVVAYKTEQGTINVIDPFCPHLGAHLGHGGKIVGENIECPFHAWQFGTDGKCANVPYSDGLPPQKNNRGCINHWPIKEVQDIVYIWYDNEGNEPWFDIDIPAELSDRSIWSKPKIYSWTLDSHIQELVENAVDTAHFTKVHEKTYKNILPKVDESDFSSTSFSITTTSDFDVLGKKYPTTVFVRCDGLGVMHVESLFTDKMGLHLTMAMRPAAAGKVELRAIIQHRISKNPLLNVFQRLFAMDFFPNEVEHDIKIWKNKRYVPKPVLSKDDGPIMPFRKWCEQFYSSPDSVQPMIASDTLKGAA